MKKYIVFGECALINSLFDIIHALSGKVYKIYQNVPEKKEKRVLSFKQRVALLGYEVETFSSLDTFRQEDGCEYVLGFTIHQKQKLVKELKEKFNIKLSSLISPDAYIGSNVHIGEGVNILPKAVVDSNVFIGDFCTINKSAVIGHDSFIDKYSVISPSATLAGASKIGEKCTIGMNCSILDGITIGDWTVIGAGSTVTKDIPNGVIAFGSPAKVIRENLNVTL